MISGVNFVFPSFLLYFCIPFVATITNSPSKKKFIPRNLVGSECPI